MATYQHYLVIEHLEEVYTSLKISIINWFALTTKEGKTDTIYCDVEEVFDMYVQTVLEDVPSDTLLDALYNQISLAYQNVSDCALLGNILIHISAILFVMKSNKTFIVNPTDILNLNSMLDDIKKIIDQL